MWDNKDVIFMAETGGSVMLFELKSIRNLKETEILGCRFNNKKNLPQIK